MIDRKINGIPVGAIAVGLLILIAAATGLGTNYGGGGAYLAIGAAFYFAPTLIAWRKRKRNTRAIFTMNAVLGWTVIGWLVALVWAQTVDSPMPVATVAAVPPGTPTP